MSRYERHLRELAAELGADIYLYREPFRAGRRFPVAWAQGRSASVYSWHGNSKLAYLAGLHELGHIAHGHIDDSLTIRVRYWDRIVDAEAEAWDWALNYARIELPPSFFRAMRNEWLGSYIRDHGRGKEPVFEQLVARVGLAA